MANGPGADPPFDRAGRDGLRHPMQWDASATGGVHDRQRRGCPVLDPPERNVESQRDDPASLLALYRRLIELRRGLGEGFRLLDAEPGVVAYERGDHVVAVNTTAEQRQAPAGEPVLTTHDWRGLPAARCADHEKIAPMAEIAYDSVDKIYPDGTQAVHDLDLEIGDGELMVLVGPSGCGKTTALRMLAGLEEISEGEIRIGDRVVNDLTPKDRDIAMVFQSYALYPHMTVEQNLAFGLKLRKVPKKEINERVRQVARILKIEEFLKRKPRALSGGQRQRVAMGRAIVREPQAFLMDEPLSNLDAKLRVQMRAEIHQLQRRLGVTTIYVTHDQVEAMTMGDRVAVMNAGHLQQVDTPQTLYDQPRNEFVAGFIGSPSINLVEAQLERQNGSFAVSFGNHRLAVDEQAARNRSKLGDYAAPRHHSRDPSGGLRGRQPRVGHTLRPEAEGDRRPDRAAGFRGARPFRYRRHADRVERDGRGRRRGRRGLARRRRGRRPLGRASSPASARELGSPRAARSSSRSTRAASTSSTPRRAKRSRRPRRQGRGRLFSP